MPTPDDESQGYALDDAYIQEQWRCQLCPKEAELVLQESDVLIRRAHKEKRQRSDAHRRDR